MAKKLLLIGMIDSIHFANWLERIESLDIDILIFPSRHYRRIHPKIANILENNSSIKIANLVSSPRMSAYLEYFLDRRIFVWLPFFSRIARLRKILWKHEFTRIHAIEMQHAGYLLLKCLPHGSKFKNIILTNWGSDIYFYRQFPEHMNKIMDCLKMANFYSAECLRDYELAQEFGFSGIALPLVPNSTTFSEDHFKQSFSKPTQRNQLIMKCYGSPIGYGEVLLQVAEQVLLDYEDINVYAYSVTEDLFSVAKRIKKRFPKRFRYTSVKSSVSHSKMLEEFSSSRIYIGASKSDGISTSFLEALATGAFPIQTSTSCAGEWVKMGAHAAIVPPNKVAIQNKLYEIMDDFESLQDCQSANLKLAKEKLSYPVISKLSQEFYS